MSIQSSAIMNPHDFLMSYASLLYKQETVNARLLGSIERMNRKNSISSKPNCVELLDGGNAVGLGYFKEHTHLELGQFPNANPNLIYQILSADFPTLNQITGPAELTDKVVAALAQSGNWELLKKQGLYKATEIIQSTRSVGHSAVAKEDSNLVVSNFLTQFMEECFPHRKDKELYVRKTLERLLPQGCIQLWINQQQEPVSMAARVRETRNTSSISLVYTPIEFRGLGYAGNVVAAISKNELSRGKSSCNLYADLSNPASNRVYKKIGFQQVGVSHSYRISP